MLRLLIIPLLLLLGHPTTPTDPGTETLKYEVRYLYGALSPRVANATFQLKPEVWEGKEVYWTDILIRVKPIFRLFLNAEYLVKGCFTRPGMEPLYYYTPSGGECWCRYTEGEKGVYYSRQVGKVESPEISVFPNDGRTRELMSMLYFARTYDFKQGVPCQIKIILGGKLFPATLTWESTDTERYPGHSAQVLHLVFAGQAGLMENGSGNEAFLWREAEGSHPILGLQVGLGKKGTMVCNILEEK